jgi:hypothetical protein
VSSKGEFLFEKIFLRFLEPIHCFTYTIDYIYSATVIFLYHKDLDMKQFMQSLLLSLTLYGMFIVGTDSLRAMQGSDDRELAELKKDRCNAGMDEWWETTEATWWDAVKNNRLDIIEEFLCSGFDPDTKIASPFHYNNVKFPFIGLTPPLVIWTDESETSLMIAAREGYTNMVKLLLKYQAHPDIQNKHGDTALMIATYRRQPEIVRLLIQANARIDIKNQGLDSPWLYIMKRDDVYMAAHFFTQENTPDCILELALTKAVRMNNIYMTQIILSAMYDRKMNSLYESWAPAPPKICSLVGEYNNPKTYTYNDDERTTLIDAIHQRNIVEFAVLLKIGIDPKIADKNGHNAYWHADHCCDPNYKDIFHALLYPQEAKACSICHGTGHQGTYTFLEPCGHYFHKPCIDKEFEAHPNICPLCTKNICPYRGVQFEFSDAELIGNGHVLKEVKHFNHAKTGGDDSSSDDGDDYYCREGLSEDDMDDDDRASLIEQLMEANAPKD